MNSSGRELYGESFTSTLSRDFTISVPGITNDEGKATLSFISRGNGTITMNVDGNALISGSVSVPSDEYEVARELYRERAWTADKGETVKVNIGYSTTGHKNVHLNYFRLQMKRQLKVYDNYTFFRSLSARGNASRFVIQGADASTLVFDVNVSERDRVVFFDSCFRFLEGVCRSKTFTDKSSRDGRRGGESESACFATARYDHYCPA